MTTSPLADGSSTAPSTAAGGPAPRTRATRSIAAQDVAELGGPRSVLVRQRRDHAELDRLLEEVAHADGVAQDDAVNRLARLVFPHAYGEETVLWPVLRRVVPDGHALTLRNEHEHQAVNARFSELDRTPAGDPRRAALVTELTALLRQDARDEEDLLLPRLQAALTPTQLRRLGAAWEIVRRTAPTRPHAVVSRRPPGNVLAALPLAVLDRARDRLDRAARSRPAAAGPLQGASRALAGVAGAVERWAPLRRGEDRSTRAA